MSNLATCDETWLSNKVRRLSSGASVPLGMSTMHSECLDPLFPSRSVPVDMLVREAPDEEEEEEDEDQGNNDDDDDVEDDGYSE